MLNKSDSVNEKCTNVLPQRVVKAERCHRNSDRNSSKVES
jgi:hypothetical protein